MIFAILQYNSTGIIIPMCFGIRSERVAIKYIAYQAKQLNVVIGINVKSNICG